MAIATTLKTYLDRHHVDYEVLAHDRSDTTLEAAHAAQVPSHQVAKAVVLEDADGYLVSVLPSTNRLDLEWLRESTGRDLELAREDELPALFEDCVTGAVPALGKAYGLDVVWDDQLENATEIYIEAGDHEHLVHLGGDDFRKLMEDQQHSIISAEREVSHWMRG